MVEAAGAGEVDVLWSSGGSFLEVLPDPAAVRAALARVPLRVHQDIVVTSQMLVEGDDVLLLPVATRYEQEGGGTETTTERRIVFSPELPRRVGEARSEWRLFAEVASRVRPDLAAAFAWPDNHALRAEIAEVVPAYAGIEALAATGDQVQWGRAAPLRRRRVPDTQRPGSLQRPGARGPRPRPRRVHRRHPPRQAVQLDGPRVGRSAHWGRPDAVVHRRRRCRGAWCRRGAAGCG